MVSATGRKEIKGIHDYRLRAPRHIDDGEELDPTVQQISPVLVAGRSGARREELISPLAPPPRPFTTIDKATHWTTRIAMRPLAPSDQNVPDIEKLIAITDPDEADAEDNSDTDDVMSEFINGDTPVRPTLESVMPTEICIDELADEEGDEEEGDDELPELTIQSRNFETFRDSDNSYVIMMRTNSELQ
jgi:hypothetical protein